MQCADIFWLRADVCQLGLDQRKVNALALEFVRKYNGSKDNLAAPQKAKLAKPVILSHHMLLGLKAGQAKMSKSDADSAIFMEDSADNVRRKIMAAYCPVQLEEDDDVIHVNGGSRVPVSNAELKNPCLDYIEHILFNSHSDSYDDVSRSTGYVFRVPKHVPHDVSSDVECEYYEYTNYQSLYQDFVTTHDNNGNDVTHNKITPLQLKLGLITSLNALLEPVRVHFRENTRAKDLLGKIQSWKEEELAAKLSKAANLADEKIGTSKAAKLAEVVPSCPTILYHSDVIVLPYPSIDTLTYSRVMSLANVIRAKLATGTTPVPNTRVVLFIPDWCAYATDPMLNEGTLAAYYAVLFHGLRCLAHICVDNGSEANLAGGVTTVYQSSLILPHDNGNDVTSDYMRTLMNMGRKLTLHDVMHPNELMTSSSTSAQVAAASLSDQHCAGFVLAQLLHVTDLLRMMTSSSSNGMTSSNTTTVRSISTMSNPLSGAWEVLLHTYQTRSGYNGIDVITANIAIYSDHWMDLSLLTPHVTDYNGNDVTTVNTNNEYFLTDSISIAKSKLRKSFCLPQNLAFCPVLTYADVFVLGTAHDDVIATTTATGSNDDVIAATTVPRGSLTLHRKPENGGDVTYTSRTALHNAFMANLVHPADLKNAMGNVMLAVMNDVSNAMDVNIRDCVKVWCNGYEKKARKMKKK